MDCSGTTEEQNKYEVLDQSFEWLCPNPTCTPNHHRGLKENLQTTSNRFTTLTKCKNSKKKPSNKIKSNTISEKKIKEQKEKRSPKEHMLKMLTGISTEDYIGKEICKACNKKIHKKQKAISCDACERWIHLKCSDMTKSRYKENEIENKDFPWVCDCCREPEVIIKDKIDLKKLKTKQLPITNSELKKATN